MTRLGRRTAIAGGLALLGGGLPVIARVLDDGGVPRPRRPSERDDTARVQEMLDAGAPVILGAGAGGGPQGAWLFDRLQLRPGARLRGAGRATLVRPATAATACAIEADSGAPGRQVPDIAVADLVLRGHVREAGFREHHNLLNLVGVRGAVVRGVGFEGFRGDGLFVGGRTWARARIEDRLNGDILVEDCTFDGLTRDNRNAISVTGGDRVTINRCSFTRCTRSDMPGAVTFETDPGSTRSFSSATVSDCTFSACGGNVGQISFTAQANVPPPFGIRIMGNTIAGSVGTGSDIAVAIALAAGDRGSDIAITGNKGSGGISPFRLFSGRGIALSGNAWQDYGEMALIGFAGSGNMCSDVRCADHFERCGLRANRALGIFNAAGVTLDGTRFTDCGDRSATSAALFLGDGRIAGLALAGMTVESPRGVTRIAIERARQNRLTGRSIGSDTVLGGLLDQTAR